MNQSTSIRFKLFVIPWSFCIVVTYYWGSLSFVRWILVVFKEHIITILHKAQHSLACIDIYSLEILDVLLTLCFIVLRVACINALWYPMILLLHAQLIKEIAWPFHSLLVLLWILFMLLHKWFSLILEETWFGHLDIIKPIIEVWHSFGSASHLIRVFNTWWKHVVSLSPNLRFSEILLDCLLLLLGTYWVLDRINMFNRSILLSLKWRLHLLTFNWWIHLGQTLILLLDVDVGRNMGIIYLCPLWIPYLFWIFQWLPLQNFAIVCQAFSVIAVEKALGNLLAIITFGKVHASVWLPVCLGI